MEAIEETDDGSVKAYSNVLRIPDKHYHWHDQFLALASGTKLRAVGISLFVLGNLMNFYALALANQTMLSALGSVQFLVNVIFAYFGTYKHLVDRL